MPKNTSKNNQNKENSFSLSETTNSVPLEGAELVKAAKAMSSLGFPVLSGNTLLQSDIDANPDLLKGITTEELNQEEKDDEYTTPEYIYVKTDKRFKAADGKWYQVLKIREPRFSDFPKNYSLTDFEGDIFNGVSLLLPYICEPKMTVANFEVLPLVEINRITFKAFKAFFFKHQQRRNQETLEELQEKQQETNT